jgi:FtsP/CotA-like multicopper oxidase with cupredoxin domain
MKQFTKHNGIACTIGVCLLAAASAWGAQKDVYLLADKFPKTLPGGVTVEMWGFAETAPDFTGGTLSSPGPVITVLPTETPLIIHLKNNLPEPVSIVIPGQNGFVLDAPHSTFTDAQGRIRAKSFVKEAAVGGGTQVYTWNNLQPGTYLYYSGSHPALQVQMGLYGAVKKDFAAGQAYDGAPLYTTDVTLLLSQIDVHVHNAVATGNFHPQADPNNPVPTVISSMIDSVPEYFLVNGEPYIDPGSVLSAGAVGQTTLVRLLNACADDRIPVLNNYRLNVIAEDGQKYAYPQDLSAVFLPALKTKDALLVPNQAGTFMLYDRRLGLVNGTIPNGGIYQKLTVTP